MGTDLEIEGSSDVLRKINTLRSQHSRTSTQPHITKYDFKLIICSRK